MFKIIKTCCLKTVLTEPEHNVGSEAAGDLGYFGDGLNDEFNDNAGAEFRR